MLTTVYERYYGMKIDITGEELDLIRTALYEKYQRTRDSAGQCRTTGAREVVLKNAMYYRALYDKLQAPGAIMQVIEDLQSTRPIRRIPLDTILGACKGCATPLLCRERGCLKHP